MKTKTRLAFINYSLNVGGVETLILEICKRLDKQLFEPYIFVFERDGKLKNEYTNSGVSVVELIKNKGFDFILPVNLAMAFRKYNINIIHTHNPSNWLYGGIAARIAGIPLVHTEHTTADYNGRHVKRWELIENMLAKMTDHITTVSESVKDYMVRCSGVASKKIEVIHNAIRFEDFDIAVDREIVRKDLSIDSAAAVIGSIARFYENKDHKTLLRAFKLVVEKNKNAYLLLIGDGPLKESSQKIAEDLGVYSNVRFLGNRRDIPQLLKVMDLFVLSSKREGLPIVILEAMAAGLPVVATDVDGNREAVINGQTGLLIPASDCNSLASAMDSVLNDKVKAASLGDNGRERIKSNFNFDRMIHRYESIYKLLLNKKYKICISGEFPPPPAGMGLQAKLLTDRLMSDGFTVSTIKRNINFAGVLRWVNNVKILRSFFRSLIYICRLVVEIPRVNIVHIFSNSYLDFFLYTCPAVCVGKLLRKKVIIHYHGGSADAFIGKYIFFVKPIMKMADQVIVPSGFLKDIFMNYGMGVSIIPNVCDLDRFDFRQREIFLPNFIVTRNLEKKYNIQCVIQAFKLIKARYPSARLTVLGKGSEEASLKQMAKELGVSDSVCFTGSVDNDKVPALYRQSDIFLNTSSVDNMPISVLEAFACGLPVISANTGGLRYMVEDGKTGFLTNFNDHNAMAERVFGLLESQEQAKRISADAREYVKSFSWDNVRGKWAEVYTV